MNEDKNQEENKGSIDKTKPTATTEKLKSFQLDKRKAIIVVVVGIILIFIILKGLTHKTIKPKVTNATNSTLQVNSSALLERSLDQKISQIANATENNTQSIQELKSAVMQMQNATKSQSSAGLPSAPALPAPPPQQQIVTQPTAPPAPPAPARIQEITIKPSKTSTTQESKTESQNYVTLPDGSVVSVTLASGIYAPIAASQSLPTIFNVNEMFYGPNHTRIPLQACKILADASGNQATSRAFVNAYELSCVLPNGKSEHFKISGYISDKKDSAYGLKGKIISVTGKYITGSFLAGILQGFGQAMSQANSNSALTTSGTVNTSVSGGEVGKYTGYAGLAGGANALAQYYSNKLNTLVDMIYVPAGTKAYLIVNKGAVIKGFKLNTINHYGYEGVD